MRKVSATMASPRFAESTTKGISRAPTARHRSGKFPGSNRHHAHALACARFHTEASERGLSCSAATLGGPVGASRLGKGAGTSKLVARAEPKEAYSQEAVLRSEAEAPFRVFRIACYAALAVSAGLGGLIALTRVIAGFAKGEILISNLLASEDVTGLGIDFVALAVLLSLYKKESGEREKQIKRLQRETTLAQLKVSLQSLELMACSPIANNATVGADALDRPLFCVSLCPRRLRST